MSSSNGSTKSRWAAIGAAVAVAVGAGGIGLVRAAPSTEGSVFVAITPCRLVDTRPGTDNVGGRTSPLGPAEVFPVAVRGSNGLCRDASAIPSTATGVLLNVTAVGATGGTFLTIWPSDASRPTASSLNPAPGQGPVPNAVTTGISADGRFSIFNSSGSVDVIVDVAGYYTGPQLSSADVVDEPGVVSSASAVGSGNVLAVSSQASVASVQIRPPADGFVTVMASGSWYAPAVDRQLVCQLTGGATTIVFSDLSLIDTNAAVNLASAVSMQRTFAVAAAAGIRTFNLVCSISGGGFVRDISMTAMYFPTSYAP
jgi:hypothetical protein